MEVNLKNILMKFWYPKIVVHFWVFLINLSGTAINCRAQWDPSSWCCWPRRHVEEETLQPIARPLWVFASWNSGATASWKGPTWERAGWADFGCLWFIPYTMWWQSFQVFSLLGFELLPLGCQDRDRENAYSDGGNWAEKKETGGQIQGAIPRTVSLFWVP